MTGNRILIISQNRLFAEAISRTLQSEGIAVALTVETVSDALGQLDVSDGTFDTIIVDYTEGHRPQDDMINKLHHINRDCRIIFLTLHGNQMEVHHWRHVANVTPLDLVSVLRGSSAGTIAGDTA